MSSDNTIANSCGNCPFISDSAITSYTHISSVHAELQKIKLSVVVPVYNEINTLEEIVNRIMAVNIPKEIVIVDDCSTDGTRDILKKFSGYNNIKIVFHEKNQGKGAAVRTGFKHITGDIAIVQDADLEYDPQEYYRMLEPIVSGKADVVYGSRFLGGPHRVHLFWHYVANCFLTTVSNMFNNINLTDMEVCYKAFRAEVIRKMELKSNRFGFDPEVTAKVAKMGCRIYEVPISYSGRSYFEGKKITWKDGIVVLLSILRFSLFGRQSAYRHSAKTGKLAE